MVISGIAIMIVFLSGYMWLTRGFFSALLHLICTVIAGAIAFGVWEHVAKFFLDNSSTSGFGAYLGGVAWALGLALPFAAILAVLRVAVDSTVRFNVNPGDTANYAGGAVCGGLAGIITAGVAVISLGFLRMETSFLQAQQVGYHNSGYIVRNGDGVGSLILPVDKLTVKFYGLLSEASFRTADPLARYHPNLHEQPASLRINAFEGKARNTSRTEDFAVTARYTVGKGSNKPLAELTKDRWSQGSQVVKDVNDDDYPAGSHIEMFLVNFMAGAKERDGKVVIGAAQVRLLLENAQNKQRIEVYPIAASSQADTQQTTAGRWRFDSRDTFIASVGGASEALFGFEFVCPPGFEPVALYVKNARHLIGNGATSQAKRNFATTDERDLFIVSMTGGTAALPEQIGLDSVDAGKAVKVGDGRPLRPGVTIEIPGVRITPALPFVLQDGTFRGLTIEGEKDKSVVVGQVDLDVEYPNNIRNPERNLRIERFSTTDDTNMVQVDVGGTSPNSLLGPIISTGNRNNGLYLVDTNGTRYSPVGYVYYDEQKITIRFDPGSPITSMDELPTLSKSRPKQKLTLLYRVSLGAEVKFFMHGTKAVVEYDPPIPCNQQQHR